MKNNLYAWMNYFKNDLDFYVVTNSVFKKESHIKLIKVSNKHKTVLDKLIYTLQITLKARKLLRRPTFDYVFFNINSYNILIPIILIRNTPGAKKVLLVGSDRLVKYIEEFRVRFGPSPVFLKRFIFSYFDQIITVSNKLRSEIVNTYKLKKGKDVKHLPGFSLVQTNRIKPLKPIKSYYRKFNASSDDFVITYIGNFNRTRGILTLLKSMRRIRANQKMKLLLCWNESGSAQSIKSYIKKYNLTKRVVIKKTVDIRKAFAITSVFVMPLENQTNILEWPLSIVESLYFGVPVICSRQISFSELIIDGYNGLYFNTGDYNNLAGKISQLYLDNGLYNSIKINTKKSLNEIYSSHSKKDFLIWLAK